MRGLRSPLFAACLALLTIGAAEPSVEEAVFQVRLDAARPLVAQIALTPALNWPERVVIAPARGGNRAAISHPACDGEPLKPAIPAGWVLPTGCNTVRWTVRLIDQDDDGIDASLPASSWSTKGNFWFLSEGAGFLRPLAPDVSGRVEVEVALPKGSTVTRRYPFPASDQPPFYAVVGLTPTRVYGRRGIRLLVYGREPPYRWMAHAHVAILDAWADWRRDVLPAGIQPPDELAFAWLNPPTGAEPGFSASAGAAAIAMQAVPRMDDPDTELKLRAAMTLVGSHEGFHTLVGAAGQTWPAWVNESLANTFAYMTAKRHLDARHMTFVDRQVMASADVSLMEAQRLYVAGDGSQALIFYGKGARFWMAIERVLITRTNGSGKLAALLQDTSNMAGLDWSNPDAVAQFLDQRSAGRAGVIVRCYLVDRGCDESKLSR
jgi:hypothetical protein